jgi:Fibronectin type III domain
MSTKKTKQPPLHIALGYSGLTDSDVAANALAAHDGVKAHPELFPNPPDLDAFMTTIQTFEAAIAAAKDGGKKAVSQKNKDRAATIKLMRQLGHYVEANCKDDITVVNASGYKVAAATKAPPQPLPQGVIDKVTAGPVSGQIVVKGKPIPKARSFVIRYAQLGSDNKPGTWTEIALTNPRTIHLTGLTPGTTYAMQIRALGVLGFGEWSEVATRMSL